MSDARIVVATDDPTFAARAFWRAVAASGTSVEVVAMTPPNSGSHRHVDNGFTEVLIPRREYHDLLRDQLMERPGGNPRLGLGMLHGHTPDYGDALATASADASLVVADGVMTAPALLRHTSLPLLVDARDVVAAPGAGAAGSLSAAAERISGEGYRWARLIRSYSVRQAEALAHGLSDAPHRLFTLADSGQDVDHVATAQRQGHIARLGLQRRPLVLALELVRPVAPQLRLGLQQLERDAGVQVITRAEPGQLAELLALASLAVGLDDGPGPRGDLLTYARAGVPLLAEAAALAEADLPEAVAVPLAGSDDLAAAVQAALASDPVVRVGAALAASAGREVRAEAHRFLSQPQIAAILEWERHSKRRRRHLSAKPGAFAA